MALDIGLSPAWFGWPSAAAARSEPTVWKDFVLLLERAGHDCLQIQRIPTSEFWRAQGVASAKLDQIEQDLERYFAGERKGAERTLVIPADAPMGFDVELFISDCGISGSFGGLAQEFDSVPAAMKWVRRALSSSYRLRTIRVGGIPREWRLEPARGSRSWADCLEGGHMSLMSMFGNKTIDYRQNTLGLDLGDLQV